MAILQYVTEVRASYAPSLKPYGFLHSWVRLQPPAAPGAVGLQLYTNALGDARRHSQFSSGEWCCSAKCFPDVYQTLILTHPFKKSEASKPLIYRIRGSNVGRVWSDQGVKVNSRVGGVGQSWS